LTELIMDCGVRFDSLERINRDLWYANAEDFGREGLTYIGKGSTPEEAVRNLLSVLLA